MNSDQPPLPHTPNVVCNKSANTPSLSGGKRKSIQMIVIITAFLLSLPCISSGNECWIDSTFNDSTLFITDVIKIDSTFLSMAGNREKSDFFKMANPNEDFNSTDNLIKDMPRQRLICYGKNGRFQFLAYEQGGRGKHNVFLAYRDHKVIKWLTFYEMPVNPMGIKEIIRKKVSSKPTPAAENECSQ